MLKTFQCKIVGGGRWLRKYRARVVKGGDLRSSANSAWVRTPPILFFILTFIHIFSFINHQKYYKFNVIKHQPTLIY